MQTLRSGYSGLERSDFEAMTKSDIIDVLETLVTSQTLCDAGIDSDLFSFVGTFFYMESDALADLLRMRA